MLRIQNKIQLRTSKRGYAWILGFDSQAFYFGKGKPQEQGQEAPIMATPTTALKTVLVLSLFAGLVIIVLLNLVR